jgi:hypothetical protein
MNYWQWRPSVITQAVDLVILDQRCFGLTWKKMIPQFESATKQDCGVIELETAADVIVKPVNTATTPVCCADQRTG